MKHLALIILLVGLILLSAILLFQKPIITDSPEEIQDLEENQKVKVIGYVVKESTYQALRIITLENGISFTCSDCPSYLNKNITSIAQIDLYNNKKELHALTISDNSPV
jgi:hypothetical protein